mmetsp:Transcript_73612/g.204605  ORF Transcript_73612/g.204605 Transcript_73612/m.204605 type:complete len:222 (+) Transcript_73612:1326-1991(+)
MAPVAQARVRPQPASHRCWLRWRCGLCRGQASAQMDIAGRPLLSRVRDNGTTIGTRFRSVDRRRQAVQARDCVQGWQYCVCVRLRDEGRLWADRAVEQGLLPGVQAGLPRQPRGFELAGRCLQQRRGDLRGWRCQIPLAFARRHHVLIARLHGVPTVSRQRLEKSRRPLRPRRRDGKQRHRLRERHRGRRWMGDDCVVAGGLLPDTQAGLQRKPPRREPSC